MYNCYHAGRERPRHEIAVLCSLAALGVPGTAQQAAEILALSKKIPQDFTDWLSQDFPIIPEAAHIYARSVGIVMINWWRDYWMLRHILTTGK